MAKSKVNKSQAIRDVFAEDPKIKTRDVVARLAERGIKVAPTLVYFVKNQQNKKRRRQKREQAFASAQKSGAASPVNVVLRLKALAQDLGGYKTLKQLVDALAE